MYRRNDPRFRRTLNEISQTIESANETAQARVYFFGKQYINPCLSTLGACFNPCLEHCYPGINQRTKKTRGRGRAELNFDFYDDWEDDETDGLLGWGDDEYDGYLAGPESYGTTQQQPARQQGMNYGTRGPAKARRGSLTGADEATTSYFSFLGRLRGRLGPGKGLRYKPSAAGLQEHPGASKKLNESESEPLMTDDSDGDAVGRRKKHGRNRSGTTGSAQTTSSFSSRGDLFLSEGEDDAVMLDDEFAMVLERRTTEGGNGPDDGSSGVISSGGNRPRMGSRKSTRSSRTTQRSKRSSLAASSDLPVGAEDNEPETINIPTLNELKQEEEQARIEEETTLEQRRIAAQRLAEDRGLSAANSPTSVRTPTSRSTPERQLSQHQDDCQRMTQTENAVSSIATIRPSLTPSAGPSTNDLRSGWINNEDDEALDSPSFEAARLPRFS